VGGTGAPLFAPFVSSRRGSVELAGTATPVPRLQPDSEPTPPLVGSRSGGALGSLQPLTFVTPEIAIGARGGGGGGGERGGLM
jgi:hypothetical protein